MSVLVIPPRFLIGVVFFSVFYALLIDNQLIIRRLWGVRNVQKHSVKECWFFDGETLNLRVY